MAANQMVFKLKNKCGNSIYFNYPAPQQNIVIPAEGLVLEGTEYDFHKAKINAFVSSGMLEVSQTHKNFVKSQMPKVEEAKKEVNADVNNDGKVDEKDLSAVHKAYSKENKKNKKKNK